MLPLEEITTSYTFTFKLLPSSLWGLVTLAPLFPTPSGIPEVMHALYFFFPPLGCRSPLSPAPSHILSCKEEPKIKPQKRRKQNKKGLQFFLLREHKKQLFLLSISKKPQEQKETKNIVGMRSAAKKIKGGSANQGRLSPSHGRYIDSNISERFVL